jgi:hypothetical protein
MDGGGAGEEEQVSGLVGGSAHVDECEMVVARMQRSAAEGASCSE